MENKPTLSEAIEVVKNALKEDRDTNKFGYYEAWEDSISESIIREFETSELSINVIANKAAKNFLNTLINQP
jgi:hypothetical protein